MAWARWRTVWVVRVDDNHDGGDDNYPRVVLETAAVGYAEGRGWTGKNSCR
jgi:hypothetical protein